MGIGAEEKVIITNEDSFLHHVKVSLNKLY